MKWWAPLHAELEQFCAVLGGVQKVLQNVMEEQNQGKLGPPLKRDGSFLALKQIHAAVQEGNNVIDDIIHTRKCVVNFFSDEYLSKIKRATAKIQLALTSARFYALGICEQDMLAMTVTILSRSGELCLVSPS